MILVDTSVWIDHLRRAEPALQQLLSDGQVVCHPFVIGELACGHLKGRDAFLALLDKLPSITRAAHDEALGFVETHRLSGRGLGWCDVHLLVSTALTPGAQLWTRDKALSSVAGDMGVLHQPSPR